MVQNLNSRGLPNQDLQFPRRHPHPLQQEIRTVSHIALKVNEWKLDFSIAGVDDVVVVVVVVVVVNVVVDGVGVGDQGRNCFSSLNFCCWFMADCRRANVAKQARTRTSLKVAIPGS